MIKLRIFNEEDRVNVASILIRNGYRVEQTKKPRIGANGQKTKSVDYMLIAEDRKEAGTE